MVNTTGSIHVFHVPHFVMTAKADQFTMICFVIRSDYHKLIVYFIRFIKKVLPFLFHAWWMIFALKIRSDIHVFRHYQFSANNCKTMCYDEKKVSCNSFKIGQVKFCPGKLTRVFQYCLFNPNSVPVLPRLPTLMSNPVIIYYRPSEILIFVIFLS